MDAIIIFWTTEHMIERGGGVDGHDGAQVNTVSIHMHIISKSRIFKEICEKNQYTD